MSKNTRGHISIQFHRLPKYQIHHSKFIALRHRINQVKMVSHLWNFIRIHWFYLFSLHFFNIQTKFMNAKKTFRMLSQQKQKVSLNFFMLSWNLFVSKRKEQHYILNSRRTAILNAVFCPVLHNQQHVKQPFELKMYINMNEINKTIPWCCRFMYLPCHRTWYFCTNGT